MKSTKGAITMALYEVGPLPAQSLCDQSGVGIPQGGAYGYGGVEAAEPQACLSLGATIWIQGGMATCRLASPTPLSMRAITRH
eukprot:CAMPEP_0173296884 /NCGR_PEP_ID=MMETSP1143-20121109/15200_1 /TAXON_ID=483371 /ORGANISM="non described non described, Strain CCMP2298" /LENGTH=82 /DNA_ID=CAMNT_0014236769 /DNA_START=13 /DNA_END=258 /DNA_ORIENTATION=+